MSSWPVVVVRKGVFCVCGFCFCSGFLYGGFFFFFCFFMFLNSLLGCSWLFFCGGCGKRKGLG